MTKKLGLKNHDESNFLRRVGGDFASAMTIFMCGIGDQLGLFKDLANNGPATPKGLAKRMNLNERYLKEWLEGMHAARYIDFDPLALQFSIQSSYIPVLAEEAGPKFMGASFQEFFSLGKMWDKLLAPFRDGGGVPQSAYSEDWWNAVGRSSAIRYNNFLLQEWFEHVPEIKENLKSGIRVADIGCGEGVALIKMAEAYPTSNYTGYDIYEKSIEMAKKRAELSGVDNIVKFKVRDFINNEMDEESFDFITAFDVLHDMARPKQGLRAIFNALKLGGILFLVDMKCSERVEENVGTISTILYGYSIMYCMTTAMSQGGKGYGTHGFPPSKVRKYCTEVGFSDVQQLSIKNPFNIFYKITK